MSTPADYWAQAQIDPSYIAQKGGLSASLKNLILGYGDTEALAPEEAAQYGIQPGDISAANQNPYSTLQQLRQQLATNQYGIGNAANSRGLSDSGAYVAAREHENQQGGQRNYNALQALQGNIRGIDQQNTNALTGAYGSIATDAANTPTPTPAPLPTVAPNSSPGSPGIPNVTPTGAHTLPGYQIQGPQNTGLAMTPKPPKPPMPKIVGPQNRGI